MAFENGSPNCLAMSRDVRASNRWPSMDESPSAETSVRLRVCFNCASSCAREGLTVLLRVEKYLAESEPLLHAKLVGVSL